MTEPRYPLLALSRHRMELDGEGVTTLVAGAGCPLSCSYCINKALLCQVPTLVSASELYEKTRIDDLYFRATNGGLCFGGGESLLHPDFYEVLKLLCPDWRLTAETALHVPTENVRRAAQIFDAFIIDVKTFDPAIYRSYTGCGPELMRENLAYLTRKLDPARLHIRVPLIPEHNDQADQERTAAALESMGLTNIERFSYVIR